MDAIRLLQHAKCTRKHRDRRGAWASRGSYLRFEDRSSSISGAEMQRYTDAKMQRCGWVKIAVHGTIGVCVEWPSPLGKFNDRLPLHCSTAPRHHLTHCTSEPAKPASHRSREPLNHRETIADAPVRPIWALSTAAICSYLWTTWEAVADRRSQIAADPKTPDTHPY